MGPPELADTVPYERGSGQEDVRSRDEDCDFGGYAQYAKPS
jgi:hypothetical protein